MVRERFDSHRRMGPNQLVPREFRFESTSFAPLAERVARSRRFHQPGRDG